MWKQLGFYFNGSTQCSLYLIHTEYTEMACSVAPVGKCWPEDAQWCMIEGGVVWWGVSCPLGLRAEEGQGAGCGFHLSFHRINREQASNLGSKEFGGFPGSPVVKNPPAGIGDVSLIPGWGRSPGEGSDNTLQHSCLENPRDRGPWWATDRGVTKSQTQLNNSRESSQLRGTHTVPDGWHVISVNTVNTSSSFLCIPSVHIVNLSKTFHFSFSFLLNFKILFLEIEIQVKVLEKFPWKIIFYYKKYCTFF